MDSEQNVMVWTKIWSQIKQVNQIKKAFFFFNKMMKQLVVIVKASDGISSKTKKKKRFRSKKNKFWLSLTVSE